MSGEAAVAWLRAQIEGDMDAARALGGSRWTVEKNDDFDYTISADEAQAALAYDAVADTWREDLSGHIALHDPQDVVADCEAKLAILADHAPYQLGSEDYCGSCGDVPQVLLPCETLCHLASAYRHRDGYEKYWDTG